MRWSNPHPIVSSFFVLVTLLGCSASQGWQRSQLEQAPVEQAPGERVLDLKSEGRWIGNGISYGPHRDGQRPGGASPTASELREDLHLMLPHWNLLRIYGSGPVAEMLLSIIREDGLNMKVMQGAWIAREEVRDEDGRILERDPEAVEGNRQQIEGAIRLANQYPEIVVAISVGNETQVDWSAHRSPLDLLIGHVRRVRANVSVPVTVADDFNYWNKAESRELAIEIDFIALHAHPMWNGLQLEDAHVWLLEQLAEVRKVHPDRDIVLAETGWATSAHDEGEQAKLIQGSFGELEQRHFYRQVRDWAARERQPIFFFEAFDENWKGGSHPAEVEKHWGLFRADRSEKQAF